MKILHLIGQMVRGGAERQLLYSVQALRERGWQQLVVSFSPGNVWDERITELGIQLVGIPRHPNKLRRLVHLSLVVRRERPDIVHSWSAHTNVYAGWMLWPGPLRRIMSFRGNPAVDNYTGQPLTVVKNARVYANADCVISNSNFALDSARKAGIKMKRAEVVRNFVSAKGRARPDLNVSILKVVAAGDLIPCKAYDVLLRAFGRLSDEGLAFELTIAGDGEERTRLERLAEELGISERVTFLGSIDCVPDLFSQAQVFVHSSRSEGLSNAILEALGEGLPVVATSVGGTPEIIEHGVTGLLVPPDQPKLLAREVHRLSLNPALRGRIGKAALAHVRDICSSGTVADKYDCIYRSVADQ